jgi:hypothetical protein
LVQEGYGILVDEVGAFGSDGVIASTAAGTAVYEALFDEFGHFGEDEVWGGGEAGGEGVTDVVALFTEVEGPVGA